MGFERGHTKVAGRRRGTPNKVPPEVRLMVVEALQRLGGVDYFVWLARKHPLAFVRLLGRLLPRPVEHIEDIRPIIQVITGVPHPEESKPAALLESRTA